MRINDCSGYLRLLMFVMAAAGGSAAAGDEWGIHLEPEGVSGGAAIIDSEMFFADEPVKFTLGLFPLEENGDLESMPNHWWKQTVLEIRDRATGELVVATPDGDSIDTGRRTRKFENRPADESIVMSRGDRDNVVLTLNPLPVGDYDVALSLRSGDVVLRTHTRTIVVREGNESLEVRRAWLRHKSWAKPFADAKPYLLELALMMRPDEWGYWKTLGDLSIGQAPVEETLDYYDRAERAIRERMKSDGETELLQRSLKQATIYRRILPILQQQGGRLGILIRGNAAHAQQEYHWFDRVKERKLGRIDLDSPRFEGFDRNALK